MHFQQKYNLIKLIKNKTPGCYLENKIPKKRFLDETILYVEGL